MIKQNKNINRRFPLNAGFSEVWVHGYIMAWMILFLMFAPFLGFFASGVLVIASGALLARKIERGFGKITIRVFNESEYVETVEVIERKLELCDIISKENNTAGLLSPLTAQNK